VKLKLSELLRAKTVDPEVSLTLISKTRKPLTRLSRRVVLNSTVDKSELTYPAVAEPVVAVDSVEEEVALSVAVEVSVAGEASEAVVASVVKEVAPEEATEVVAASAVKEVAPEEATEVVEASAVKEVAPEEVTVVPEKVAKELKTDHKYSEELTNK